MNEDRIRLEDFKEGKEKEEGMRFENHSLGEPFICDEVEWPRDRLQELKDYLKKKSVILGRRPMSKEMIHVAVGHERLAAQEGIALATKQVYHNRRYLIESMLRIELKGKYAKIARRELSDEINRANETQIIHIARLLENKKLDLKIYLENKQKIQHNKPIHKKIFNKLVNYYCDFEVHRYAPEMNEIHFTKFTLNHTNYQNISKLSFNHDGRASLNIVFDEISRNLKVLKELSKHYEDIKELSEKLLTLNEYMKREKGLKREEMKRREEESAQNPVRNRHERRKQEALARREKKRKKKK